MIFWAKEIPTHLSNSIRHTKRHLFSLPTSAACRSHHKTLLSHIFSSSTNITFPMTFSLAASRALIIPVCLRKFNDQKTYRHYATNLPLHFHHKSSNASLNYRQRHIPQQRHDPRLPHRRRFPPRRPRLDNASSLDIPLSQTHPKRRSSRAGRWVARCSEDG